MCNHRNLTKKLTFESDLQKLDRTFVGRALEYEMHSRAPKLRTCRQ